MKKRILSLILALSMVLSVLPLGAFAADPPELVMKDGLPDTTNVQKTSFTDSDGKTKDKYTGSDWEYTKDPSDSTDTGILTLTRGEYDFSNTNPKNMTGSPTNQAVACAIVIELGAEITGGTFNGQVANEGTMKGTFNGDVTNDPTGKISGGTFNGDVENRGTIEDGTFEIFVKNEGTIEKGTISGGTFKGTVINEGTINNGIFEENVENDPDGTISGGAFSSTVSNYSGTISGGTFAGSVNNSYDGTVTGGVFNLNAKPTGVTGGYNITVASGAKIEKVNGVSAVWDPYVVVMKGNALPEVTVTASTEIFSLNDQPLSTNPYNSRQDSTDKNTVTFTMQEGSVIIGCGGLIMTYDGYPVSSNNGNADCKGKGWSYDKNTKTLTLTDGTFNFNSTYPQNPNNGRGAKPVACAVEIQSGVTITGGTFNGKVTNYSNGTISGGTFAGSVTNEEYGMIRGGTFAGSVNNSNYGNILGGVFNGHIEVEGIGVHSITWDAAYPNAKITEVNDVSADWKPYVVVTKWAASTAKEVTITADTEIFSLNGKSIGDGNCKSSYDGSDYKTVKFTMPGEPVVLNGAITCTDLVMEKGWPKASNEGKISCSGTGWSYDHSTKTLTLTDGTFNLSSTAPVQCEILLDSENAEITGGTFEADVKNNDGGTISDGTFNGTVKNNGGKISSGTFNGTVQHGYGTISGGTFHEKVLNSHGEITGGTFAAGLSANNGAVTGGVFNGDAYITGVTGGHFIKWDDDYSKANPNAKIEKVNGVSANWAPYVVVTELTTATAKEVTITADTEIFSLNGQPIDESNYPNKNDKTTVTFTMPDDKDVVLNKAITSTDLVMENGWPKDSNGGKNPCKGDGWEYIKNEPTNGDMLLLTDGLFDFSTIGDGSAVECKVFVGKPTAITGGEFNGKVINNSGILGGTFHGEVDNMGPGRIMNGTFKNSVENKGMIENGAFHDEVKNNGTINDGTFHGKVENNSVINSGTFNGSVDNTTMGRIENGTFNDAVENNGTIEKGTFHGEVKNNGTIENGTFHGAVENNGTINGGVFNGAVTGSGTVSESITGSGTLNGEPITKTEPEPEPEPTTYTVTVIGGTIDGKTSVSAKENDTLTVVLDQNDIPDGMTFDLWSISSSKLSGDINVDYRAEAMTFQMPPEDVTIRAQYRSAEIIEDAAPSPLATAATIAVGGAAAGIVVWQGVSLGVDLYLANALPQGVPVPTDRRALALPTLYGDIPTEEIELQKATRWAVQNGLMDAADKKDASFFDPDHYVTKMDVFGAWLRLKKLLGTT